MPRNALGTTSEDYESLEFLNGIAPTQSRLRTPIDVPQDGDTPGMRSYGRRPRRKSVKPHRYATRPQHQLDFQDNLLDNGLGADVSRETARRRGSGSRSSQTKLLPSPNSLARRPSASRSDGVFVEIPASNKPDKAKRKAEEAPLRSTRSRTQRQISSQQEFINLASDDDDDDPQFVPQPSSSRASHNQLKTVETNAALLAKEKRRRDEATTLRSTMSEAAAPVSFYAHTTRRTDPFAKHQRREGPIQLEESNDRRSTRSRSFIDVADSPEPEPEPDLEMVSSHQLQRGSAGSSRRKIVDRMKPKARSPTNSDAIPCSPSSGSPTKALPSLSPNRSPHPITNREPSSSAHHHDTNGLSKARKRPRTDTVSSSSLEKRVLDRPFEFPFELRLKAIVVSDMWRSRDSETPTTLFRQYNLFFGVNPGDLIKIQYSDIREIVATKIDVPDRGILSLTLADGSESARMVQERFPSFDPRASAEGAQIHLIAHDGPENDLLNHKRAVAWITKRLQESSSMTVKCLWLNEHAAESKTSLLDPIKRHPWPEPSAATGQQPQQQPRPRRTLIFPGAGRSPNNDVRDSARPITSYGPQVQRKKTFDIQPDSPKSSTTLAVDVAMPDAFGSPSTRTPPLPNLSMPKPKPAATPAPPKVEVRRPRVRSDGTVLQYPYEGPGAISLRDADFDRLLDGALLNDVLIEFGIKFILEEIRARDSSLADSIHVFSTFFFPILMSKTVETSYAKLRRWTSKEDIFSKKYIVIPINENYHWYLALIINPGYLLQDHGKDTSSEQDKEEVAMALTLPSEGSAQQISPHKGASAGESMGAARDEQHQDTAVDSDEPVTPPLPSQKLPLLSLGNESASRPAPMDEDGDFRDCTPPKASANPTSVDQLIIVTLDSLGQRHLKQVNKLYEYLWREAWDKKQPMGSKASTSSLDDKAEGLKPQAEVKPPTHTGEAAHAHTAANHDEILGDDAKDPAEEDICELLDVAARQPDGVRSLVVHDRRSATAPVNKSRDIETWAKTLPKAVYINARVPEQPNFCDCGIYLLHYMDRFFREPDKMLKLMVDAKNRTTLINKAGPKQRQQLKSEIADHAGAEWQAGEVSFKRAYWRSKVVELSEGWEAHRMARKAAKEESGAKSEHRETNFSEEQKGTKLEGDEKEPTTSTIAQEGLPPTSGDGDLPMPDADEDVNVEDKSSMQESKKASDDKDGGESSSIGDATLDETARSVNDVALGKDPTATSDVDRVLEQAMARQHGPLSQEHLKALQREDRDKADDLKPLSKWQYPWSDIGASFRSLPSMGHQSSSTHSPAMDAARVPDAQEQPRRVPVSPTLSNSSMSSQRREHWREQAQDETDDQEPHQHQLPQHDRQQQHRLQTAPSAFGANMFTSAASNWTEAQPPPPLSFNSSNKVAPPNARDTPDPSSSDNKQSSESASASRSSSPDSIQES